VVTITGIPSGSTVVRAYANWSYEVTTSTPPYPEILADITINEHAVTGTLTGEAPDLCWFPLAPGTIAYTADVTGIVADVGGNGTYTIGGAIDEGGAMGEGFTLLIVYENAALPLREIDVYSGMTFETGSDMNAEATFAFKAAPYIEGSVHFFVNALDGQVQADAGGDDEFFINGITAGGVVAGTGSADDAWQGQLGQVNQYGQNSMYDHAEDDVASFMATWDEALTIRTTGHDDCVGHTLGAIAFEDRCAVSPGSQYDCDGNGIADRCDIMRCEDEPWCGDCNGNHELDICEIAAAGTIHVDADAQGANDGTSWANAFTDLESALNAARNSPIGLAEIWVAEGTYRPSSRTLPYDPRTATLQLVGCVGLYGGFGGCEATREQRNPRVYVTVLSGDIGTLGDTSDNAYHVVTASGVDATAVLDGFMITGGNGGDSYDGAGLFCYAGNPTIAHCVISENQAAAGGAVRCEEGSTPLIAYCTITGNTALAGGGIACHNPAGGPPVRIHNCLINANHAVWIGTSDPLSGGALACLAANVEIANCTIADNSGPAGPALACYGASTVGVSNSILWDGGNEVLNDAGSSSIAITYSDVEGATGQEAWFGDECKALGPWFVVVPLGTGTWTEASSYDTTTGQTTLRKTGLGWSSNALRGKFLNPNTAATPALQYVIAANTVGMGGAPDTITIWGHPDAAGSGVSYHIYDYHTQRSSPCVDTGSNAAVPSGVTTDLDGRDRIVDATGTHTATVDMGAYEAPVCGAPPQDIDLDGDVDLVDFGAFQACFAGPNHPYALPGDQRCTCFDTEPDSDVDLADFLVFQACFNGPNRPPNCPPASAPGCGSGGGESLMAGGMLAAAQGESLLDSFDVTFDLQSPQAGQIVIAGNPVEWHVSVTVTGNNQGLGGYLVNLFLGPDPGPTPGPDGIWGNADDENLANVTIDPAYWAQVFAVAGPNGKPTEGTDVTTGGSGGGPGMNVMPSLGANATPGTLLQVGAAHLEWNPWRYASGPHGWYWTGENTWGVGLDARKETLLLDTGGRYELNAGWIDTTNLENGHYVLTLVPSDRATILRSDVDLGVAQPGGIATRANSVSGPVSIEFDVEQ
jgi:hypothetical protein